MTANQENNSAGQRVHDGSVDLDEQPREGSWCLLGCSPQCLWKLLSTASSIQPMDDDGDGGDAEE